MTRILSLLALLLCSVPQAQASDWLHRFLNWVDSADVAGCDTAYVLLPKEGFAAYLNANLTGNWTHISLSPDGGVGQEEALSGSLRSQTSCIISAGLSYRGWGLNYSLDMSKYGDSDITYTLYGQRYGMEFRCHNTYSLHGTLASLDGVEQLNIESHQHLCRLRTTLFNGYYVFDSKHFSHPAATSHTTIQRRSCGSWLAIFNYWYRSYRSIEQLPAFNFDKISLTHLNLGGGYAYNYVFANEHCLLNGQLTPLVTLWYRNRIYGADSDAALSQDIAFDVVAHVRFVYNSGRYITGFQSIYNCDFGFDTREFGMNSLDWSTRLFFGIRF